MKTPFKTGYKKKNEIKCKCDYVHSISHLSCRAHFSKLPVITGPIKLFCFPFQTGVSKVLNIISHSVKLLAKETKWTLLEFRTHPTFLEILISKSDFGPVKLPGLPRNRPLVLFESPLHSFKGVLGTFYSMLV